MQVDWSPGYFGINFALTASNTTPPPPPPSTGGTPAAARIKHEPANNVYQPLRMAA